MSIFHQTIPGMNSAIDIVIPGIDNNVGNELCNEIRNKTIELEKMLNCFDSNAETFQINERAYAEQVSVSDKLFEIITECFYFNKQTAGYFDIGLRYYKTEPQHSSDGGMKSIVLNTSEKTIKFESKATALDFGAVGKGLLLREVDKILYSYQIKNCFISFGGSSMLTRGSHPHGTNWPVTFRNDLNHNHSFSMNNHAASLSGALTEQSGAYHIINPKSLLTVQNNRIAFVQCSCPVVAEVLSTTLVIATLSEVETIVAGFKPDKAVIFNKTDNRELLIEYLYERNN